MSVGDGPRTGDETREDVVLPSSVAADGRAGVRADTEQGGGRMALRRDLAVIIAHPKMPAAERRFVDGDACDRCTRSLAAADAVLAAEFRRVVEDDTTADRVARAMWHVEASRYADFDVDDWGLVRGPDRDYYLRSARAAVRALREDT